MKIIVDEIRNDYLMQEFQYNGSNLHSNVYSVRLRVYKHNTPSGTLSVELRTSGGTLLATSTETRIESDVSGTYWHGMLRFNLAYPLTQGTVYQLRLLDSGTFSESNYWGWCREFDFVNNDKEYTPANDINMPYMYEIWEKS